MLSLVPKTSLFLTPPNYLFQYTGKHLSYLQNLKYFLQIGIGKLEIVPYVFRHPRSLGRVQAYEINCT